MKMMIRCVLGRLRKRQSEVALPQTLSRLFHLVKYWQISLALNSKRLC